MRRLLVCVASTALLLGALTAPSAFAQQGEPKGVVAYRIAVMRTLGAQMLAIRTALNETIEFTDNVPWHAAIIDDAAKTAVNNLKALFPEGSTENSRALPAIWEKWDEFEAQMKRFAELAAEFRRVAESGDDQATLQAFAKMGKEGCGGCHETFRKKKE